MICFTNLGIFFCKCSCCAWINKPKFMLCCPMLSSNKCHHWMICRVRKENILKYTKFYNYVHNKKPAEFLTFEYY